MLTLGLSANERLRRAIEVTFGVALGIAVADAGPVARHRSDLDRRRGAVGDGRGADARRRALVLLRPPSPAGLVAGPFVRWVDVRARSTPWSVGVSGLVVASVVLLVRPRSTDEQLGSCARRRRPRPRVDGCRSRRSSADRLGRYLHAADEVELAKYEGPGAAPSGSSRSSPTPEGLRFRASSLQGPNLRRGRSRIPPPRSAMRSHLAVAARMANDVVREHPGEDGRADPIDRIRSRTGVRDRRAGCSRAGARGQRGQGRGRERSGVEIRSRPDTSRRSAAA